MRIHPGTETAAGLKARVRFIVNRRQRSVERARNYSWHRLVKMSSANCRSAQENMAVEAETDPLAALDASLERQTRQVDAKFKLLEMDQFEAVARNCEEDGARPEAVAWRELYEESIGVPLEVRHELRVLLERVEGSGEGTVESVIGALIHRSRNGVLSSGALAGDWL